MKIPFILFLALLFTFQCISQKPFGKWRTSATGAFQLHDTRLWGYPHEDEFIKNEKDLGTTRFEFLISKSLFRGKEDAIYLGLGYSRETIRFSRPFDILYFYDTEFPELNYLGKYNINMVNIPLIYYKNISSKWYVNLSLETSFSYCKSMERNGGLLFPPKHLTEFYALELTPGIGRHFKKWDIGFQWRIFQIKQVDKAIFSKNIFSNQDVPLLDKPFDIYNPLHIALSLGYSFGK